MRKIRLIYFTTLFVAALTVSAQETDRDFIRQGNLFFRQGEVDKSIVNFQKALDKKRTVEAYYNLGCSFSLMSLDSTSLTSYVEAEQLGFNNPRKRAMNFHNMANLWYVNGLSRLRSNDKQIAKYFENAVNLYKCALRCNPDDNETRYNLAMAQWMLKKAQSGGGGQSDQSEDKNNEDNQQQQQQQQQQNEQKDEQQKKDEMSDENAEQLLKSAQQNEKDVQQKVNVQPARRKALEKDW